jgi:serine/threonine protein phosphatase 1
MSSRIRYFPRNTAGRDFIVGDIHGAFDLVWAGMQRVQFDPSKDRLFCVGDLVDRGPQSARAWRFLQLPYVHAVRGNHEQNLLDLCAEGELDEDTLGLVLRRYGAQWWLDVASADRKALLAAFSALPIVMEIETSRGTVGVVHGDVPADMDWGAFKAEIQAGNEDVVRVALQGRDRINRASESGVRGVGRVYVGHTPQWQGARRFGNVYAIDTGAIFGQIFEDHAGHLTLAPLACKTEELSGAPRQPTGSVDVVPEPDHATLDRPFGLYAR